MPGLETSIRRRVTRRLLARTLLALGALSAAGFTVAQVPQAENLPAPGLATPNFSLAVPKPAHVQLKAPPGFSISLFAENLPGVRWLQTSPNGDLFASHFGRSVITVLRDANGDGKPEIRSVYASRPDAPKGPQGPGGERNARAAQGRAPQQGRGPDDNRGRGEPLSRGAVAAVPCTVVPSSPVTGPAGLRNPMGMAFSRGYLYVANADSIIRYKYTPGDLMPQGEPERIASLPVGGFHQWRNIIFNASGDKMYVSVGSATNNRAGEDCRRAAILEFNADGTGERIFASGLRNPEGLAWQPGTNKLWTSVNERDSLGDDLAPDFITALKDGGFYGWPYAYIGQHYDPRYVGGQPELVKRSITPDVLIPAHSAPLGLTFYTASQFPPRYRGGAFVALHGSWNRSKAAGYKVVFAPFRNGIPTGALEDFLTGFVVSEGGRNPDGSIAPISQWGRPVDVLVWKDGSLLFTDDQGGRIWQIRYKK